MNTRYCDNGCGYKLPQEYALNETTCGACLDNCYTVWVGGGEITDHLVDRATAEIIARIWIEQGYTDIEIERINQ
jgi:hypothetical protein